VDTQGLDISVCEDSDDDKFVECAIASNTKILVSGDKHLLRINGYQGIKVYKPSEFIEIYLN
jgi:uncharacterized protein